MARYPRDTRADEHDWYPSAVDVVHEEAHRLARIEREAGWLARVLPNGNRGTYTVWTTDTPRQRTAQARHLA